MTAHFPRYPALPPKRLRARRSRLLLGCALGSWLPLTAVGVVKRVFTNYGILSITPEGLAVEAMVKGLTRDAL